ncbi:phospholipid carrier-dependent glycosyltransferase, partial [bacterium]|nr:phospholipid carrier-dependent glycosyltransferase [bacterium]
MERVLEKRDYIIFISVALLYFIFRLFFLNSPQKEMFDEIYYIPASQNYLEFKPDSNWVHPPLAKMIIALFAYFTPFLGFMKWRVASAFFGALIVGISYPFAMILFKNRITSFVAMFLMFFDFMTFAQSGIATLDVFLMCFMTLSAFFCCVYIFRADEANIFPAILSAIFAGLASACKWSGIFSFFFLIFCLFFLKNYKKGVKFFVVRAFFLSLSIYLISFLIPYCYCFFVGDSFTDLYLRFIDILKFQYKGGWTHNYLSPMWQWVL